MTNEASEIVGVIGLGTMGGAMAANLIKGGLQVIGFDVDAEASSRLAKLGGKVATSSQDVFERAAVSILSLPSPDALIRTANDAGDHASRSTGPVAVETSTLAITDKQEARRLFAEKGVELLDCPLSGTGAQAESGDLTVFASGDQSSFDRCAQVLTAISHTQFYLGEFGNGTRMKFVANLLVASHNVAAAEAMVLGMKAGLDPQLIYDVISRSAGTSRMFEIRGPMMVAGDYDGATMKMDLWQKDLNLIGGFARELGVSAPLFEASEELYAKALAQGRDKQDTASVCAVLEEMANVVRKDS